MKRICVGLSLLGILVALPVFAASAKPGTPMRAAVKPPAMKTTAVAKTITQQGKVKAVVSKSNSLSITWKTAKKAGKKGGVQELALQIKPETKLLSHNNPIALSAIKKGDRVEITAQKVGKIWVASRVVVLKAAMSVAKPVAPAARKPLSTQKPMAGKGTK